MNLEGRSIEKMSKIHMYEAIVDQICAFQPKYTDWEFLRSSGHCGQGHCIIILVSTFEYKQMNPAWIDPKTKSPDGKRQKMK